MLTLKVLKLTEMENHLEEIARFTELVFFFFVIEVCKFPTNLGLNDCDHANNLIPNLLNEIYWITMNCCPFMMSSLPM